MRKYKVIAIVAVLLFAIVGVATPLAAHTASNMRSGETATIGKGEVIDSSVYLAGRTVTVAGEVQGDLYCAGQTIEITGRVNGDVICAGQTIHVSGTVVGNVRVAGQTVSVDGPVGRSLTAFGQTVTQTANSVVNSDATIFGSALQLNGKVGRDIVAGGEGVTVSGVTGRNMTITDNQLTLTNGAKIGGNLEYTSAKEATVDKGAVVGGTSKRHDPPKDENHASAATWQDQLSMAAYWFGAVLVFGLALLAFAPRTFAASSKVMTSQGGWALLAGVGVLVVTPIIATMLMITVIGLPLGFALVFAWLSALVAAYAYAAYSLGAWISGQAKWNLKWSNVSWLLIGMVVLWLCMLLPIVGGLLSFIALVWGLGGMLLACTEQYKAGKAAHAAKKSKA